MTKSVININIDHIQTKFLSADTISPPMSPSGRKRFADIMLSPVRFT